MLNWPRVVILLQDASRGERRRLDINGKYMLKYIAVQMLTWARIQKALIYAQVYTLGISHSSSKLQLIMLPWKSL